MHCARAPITPCNTNVDGRIVSERKREEKSKKKKKKSGSLHTENFIKDLEETWNVRHFSSYETLAFVEAGQNVDVRCKKKKVKGEEVCDGGR